MHQITGKTEIEIFYTCAQREQILTLLATEIAHHVNERRSDEKLNLWLHLAYFCQSQIMSRRDEAHWKKYMLAVQTMIVWHSEGSHRFRCFFVVMISVGGFQMVRSRSREIRLSNESRAIATTKFDSVNPEMDAAGSERKNDQDHGIRNGRD